jgi:hypothetical protein
MRSSRFQPTLMIAAAVICLLGPWSSSSLHASPAEEDNVVVRWNAVLLQAVRNTRFAPMYSARALAIVHTCMYDAWTVYDEAAVATRPGGPLRRPVSEHTSSNKEIAISYAAYYALVDLFPSQILLFDNLMADLGLDPADWSGSPATPDGVGIMACAAVLEFRHQDGANQLGDRNNGPPYSDYTGYLSVNTSELLNDPNRWQPLRTGGGADQSFLAPHWGRVTPFALKAPDQFRPRAPFLYPHPGYLKQADEVVVLSASLGDREKMIAEYWADGPSTETPPGHWNLFAQYVSQRDGHDLDADVKLFFVLGNALLDASIAVWDCKVEFDYARPASAVRFLYAGQTIEAWAGPLLGTRWIPGESFQSYIATPPFAEYTSGHSAFSAASATVLRLFTGSPRLEASYTLAPGSSTIEPGVTPASEVTLTWRTFDDAADEAGLSRRYGGIHFRQADLESRRMGQQIGQQVWRKAREYFTGSARQTESEPVPDLQD